MTRADLMREMGVFVTSMAVSFATAAVVKYGSAWLGFPTLDFLNGWAAAMAFISAHRWLRSEA